MSRALIAFLVGLAVLIPLAGFAEAARVGSWGLTGIGFAVMLLISLLDREGFYDIKPRQRR